MSSFEEDDPHESRRPYPIGRTDSAPAILVPAHTVSQDLDTLFFEVDNLREKVKCHGETIFHRAYENMIIRVISSSSSYVKFAVHRDRTFSLKQIRWTM